LPSRTVSTLRKTALLIWRLSMERAAVSSEGTSGKAAREQRGQRAREETDLVLQPDGADERQADADAVHSVGARVGLDPADEEKDGSSASAARA
jgi:hypothetical protein